MDRTQVVNLCDRSRFWRFCLGPLVYLLSKLLNYLGFEPFEFHQVLMKVIPETYLMKIIPETYLMKVIPETYLMKVIPETRRVH